jgi:hypothetical protein
VETNRIDNFFGSGIPAAISEQWVSRGWKAAPTKNPKPQSAYLRVHRGCILTDRAYPSAHVPPAAAGCAVFCNLPRSLTGN